MSVAYAQGLWALGRSLPPNLGALLLSSRASRSPSHHPAAATSGGGYGRSRRVKRCHVSPNTGHSISTIDSPDTLAESDLVVLGLTPDAGVRPVFANGLTLAGTHNGSDPHSSDTAVLVDTQALLASSPGLDLLLAGSPPAPPSASTASSNLDPPSTHPQPTASVDSTSQPSASADGPPKTSAAGAADPAASSAAASAPDPPPADPASSTPPASTSQEQPGLLDRLRGALAAVQWGKVWALSLMFVSYVHQATTGFALPAMLPMISNELHLTDLQGALLTTGYSYLYAIALVPIGLLADRVSRPRLLAGGLAVWSILTCTASTCRSFGDLLLARVGFAAAQGAQNPVCFSLIPELFPVNKSTALSLYNCAIYVGRALSFAAVLLARHLHDNDQRKLLVRGHAQGAATSSAAAVAAAAAAAAAPSDAAAAGLCAAAGAPEAHAFDSALHSGPRLPGGLFELAPPPPGPDMLTTLPAALTDGLAAAAASHPPTDGLGERLGSAVQAHLTARGGVRLETRLDHLDRADLHSLSIMHTAGEMAAATPDREFNFPLWEYGADLPDSAWRQVLRWIALPGFLIGLAMMFTLQEPRQAAQQPGGAAAAAVVAPPPAATAAAAMPSAVAAPPLAGTAAAAKAADTGAPAAAADAAKPAAAAPSSGSSILSLLRSPGFMSVTLAAALNDVGSYALIAWQSTFYERVYGLESSAYAPVLATLLPIGGIIGGVGGGYLADRLGRQGRRWWVTAGATCAAAPCLAASCLASSPELSYAALLVGFALSEMWRAPSAVMARGLAPAHMGSSASALYLCVRNLLGGLGPLMVAGLIGSVGLQRAMMVVPLMYGASGVVFALAEKLYDKEMQAKELLEKELSL